MSELLLHGPGAGSGPIFDMECTEHSEISKSPSRSVKFARGSLKFVRIQ